MTDPQQYVVYTVIDTVHSCLLGCSPHLHHVDEVEQKLLCILLSVGGELWVTTPNKCFEHPWCDTNLVSLVTREVLCG